MFSWLGVVKVPSMLEVKVVIICLFCSSSGSMLTRCMENMALLELILSWVLVCRVWYIIAI